MRNSRLKRVTKLLTESTSIMKRIGEGIPIVIVHGGPGMDHSYLLPQMGKLAKSYKLIFYDQRAMGKSSADFDTSAMTMNSLVEDLEGIRKAFGIEKMNLHRTFVGRIGGNVLCNKVSRSFTISHPRQYHGGEFSAAEFVFCSHVAKDE